MSLPTPSGAARALAAGRLVLGAALLAAPRPLTTAWIGRDADGAGTQVAVRGLGVREAALGAGTLWALARGTGARPWILAGAGVDLGDLAATAAARRQLPWTGRGILVSASAAAIVGAWTAGALDA